MSKPNNTYTGPIIYCCPAHENDPQQIDYRRTVYQQPITTTLRNAMSLAIDGYLANFGRFPGYAWVPVIPKGAEDLMEVNGLILVKAGFSMPPRCVAVGW